MNLLKDQMAADLAVFYGPDGFAQDIQYDNGSGPVTVSAIVDFGGLGETALSADICVPQNSVPAPGYKGPNGRRQRFIIRDREWFVRMRGTHPEISGDGLEWKIGLTRDERTASWRI